MAVDSLIGILNRLVTIHSRSLAMYLGYASPTWHLGDEQAQRTLDQIVADQKATVERLVESIMDNDGVVVSGSFPTVFTGYHDLSFDFLLGKLIKMQRRDIAAIEECVGKLAGAPVERAIAEEALGQAKAHLELLQELAQPTTVV